MFEELTIRVGDGSHKVFLQDGFYERDRLSAKIHKHNYSEVHIVLSGDITYRIGDGLLSAVGGDLICIPEGELHAGVTMSDGAEEIAFQIDAGISELHKIRVSDAILPEFLLEIDRATATGDYTSLLAYMTIMIRPILSGEGVHAGNITDYGFIIREFFSNRYSEDVRLSDLAEAIHLSERQTERLMIEHTGRGFRDELTETRVKIARQLLADKSMTLGEIAGYVGYRSYAGFWKAMKKSGAI
jgi:AraC-like DNA-binding protein